MRSTLTLSGNLTGDVTLRQTATGSVAKFRMAVDDAWFDKAAGQWRSKTVYLWVSAWRQLGENVAASLALGQPVIVVGKLRQSTYEKDGVTITTVEVEAESVGHDLARGTAAFVRTPRGPQTADLAAERETVVVERSGVAA